MRFISLIILIVVFYSCSRLEKKQRDTKIKDFGIMESNSIVGSWSMCASSDGVNMIQYNVCPTISFYADGSGSEGKYKLGLEKFNWLHEGSIVKISYNKPILNSSLSDSIYVASFKKEKESTILVLSSQGNSSQLYLSH